MRLLAALSWQSPQWLALVLLLSAGAGAIVIALYWRQMRTARRLWRVMLPALRWLAIAALILSLARPIAQRARRDDEQGAVVVLLDRSRSMAVRDLHRTPAALVALADGLGQLAPGTRTRSEAYAAVAADIARLPQLVEAIQAAQLELDLAQLQGKDNATAQNRLDDAAAEFARVAQSLIQARARLRTKAPRLADALTALERLGPAKARGWQQLVTPVVADIMTRSQQFQTESDDALYRTNPHVRQACDELANLTRFELVEQALTRGDTGLLTRLPGKVPLFGFAIGPSVEPVALRGDGNRPVKRLLLQPDGDASDLTGNLREILDYLRHQDVQAVLLFSDGRQVGAEASIASRVLGGDAVPIFTVSPAPPAGSSLRDVAVERITAPASLFVGEVMTVTADIRWSGVKSRPATATLDVDGRPITLPIEPRPGVAGSATVSFTVPVTQPGPHRIVVSVPPVDGEISTENNHAQRYVKALNDRFDILLVGGSPSWDFRYLRDALARTSWVSADSILLKSDSELLRTPPGQIAARDLVILDDVPAGALSAEQWEALRRMVAQRGGSVILIAGRSYLPRQYGSETLAEFLPWKRLAARGQGPQWRQWPGEEPAFRVVPNPSSALSRQMTLSDLARESEQRWLDLPPLYRYLAMPPLKEIAEPLLVERETGAPILTRHRLGRGSVFFLAIDETWRWRYRVGPRDQERFFQQLIRSAADEPYAQTTPALSLDVQPVVVAPRESVQVRARLNEPPLDHPYPAALSLDVLKDGMLVRTQALPRIGAQDSGRYEGAVDALETGEYRLRVRSADGDEVEYPLHVMRNLEQELANLAPDEELLRRLAASSGGDFQTLDTLRDLPRLIEQSRQQRTAIRQIPLWSSWYLYGFVLGCLGLEWAMRKRLGMA